MKLSLTNWHIEVSSKCTLKCPRCPREEEPGGLINKQLTLDFFKEKIGIDIVKQIDTILFCGDDGDPIYCNELIEILQWIKSIKSTIVIKIITNGSYKPATWWKQLALTLTEYDELTWSLDGWNQASNEKYRVNSDWYSITKGIEIFNKYNSTTYKKWSCIMFRFNENNLDKIKRLAIEYNFDFIQFVKSSRFDTIYPGHYGEIDLLEPIDKTLIADGINDSIISYKLTPKQSPAILPSTTIDLARDLLDKGYAGMCLSGLQGVFLNSRGELFPCCWTASRNDFTRMWHELAQTKFNLYNRSMTEILEDSFWSDTFLDLTQSKKQICGHKCSVTNTKKRIIK